MILEFKFLGVEHFPEMPTSFLAVQLVPDSKTERMTKDMFCLGNSWENGWDQSKVVTISAQNGDTEIDDQFRLYSVLRIVEAGDGK